MRLRSLLDPRDAWRLLRTPLPEEEPFHRRAHALRGIARVVLFLGVGAVALFGITLIAFMVTLLEIGFSLDLEDVLYTALLIVAALAPIPLVVRPFAALYAREASGAPLPRAAYGLLGATCLLLAVTAPVALFVSIFVVHFDGPYVLLGAFLVTLAAPWLARSGWGLLKP